MYIRSGLVRCRDSCLIRCIYIFLLYNTKAYCRVIKQCLKILLFRRVKPCSARASDIAMDTTHHDYTAATIHSRTQQSPVRFPENRFSDSIIYIHIYIRVCVYVCACLLYTRNAYTGEGSRGLSPAPPSSACPREPIEFSPEIP